MPNSEATEAAAAAVATGPRVTLADINERVIVTEQYISSADIDAATKTDAPSTGVLTICILTLANGWQVTGESACAAKENYNAELGRKLARDRAVEKIWALEGYVLRNHLAGVDPYAITG